MKKLLSVLMAVLILLSLAACGGSQPAPAPEPAEEVAPDALSLLNTVWALYAEDERFPAFGGNQDSAEPVPDAPGAFDLSDTVGLNSLLGFPESDAEKIDNAASLIHMLNTNTFTCGAFHVTAGEDVGALASAIRDNITQRQWICGFPDKLVVVTVGNYIVSFFGLEEFVDTFQARLSEAFPTAEAAYAEPLTCAHTVDPSLWRS